MQNVTINSANIIGSTVKQLHLNLNVTACPFVQELQVSILQVHGSLKLQPCIMPSQSRGNRYERLVIYQSICLALNYLIHTKVQFPTDTKVNMYVSIYNYICFNLNFNSKRKCLIWAVLFIVAAGSNLSTCMRAVLILFSLVSMVISRP